MKKNVASQIVGAQMITIADGSNFTGSVTCYVTGDNGTQTVGSVSSGACTHKGKGLHNYAPAQAETNYGFVQFTFEGTGAITTTVEIYTSFPQTGDSYAEVTSGAYGLAVIEAQTDDIGVAGAGLTNVPWNAAWDAEVQSEVADALNVYDPPTKAELDAAVANVSVDEMQASALADFFNTNSGETYGTSVAGSVVKEITDNAGGSSLTAAAVADAVWDEATAGHTTSGTFGEQCKTDIDLILTHTTEIGVAGAGLTNINLPNQVMDITGTITGNLTGSVGSVTGAVGSVTAPVTVGTNNDKTGYTLSATGSTTLTEGYRTVGAAGTMNQILYEILAHLTEKSIASTTLTTKKVDQSAVAATYTLDDATTPSAITRAT